MRIEHWLYTIPLRLRSLFKRCRVEQELDEELQFHLEQRIETELAAGKTPEQARNSALRAMEGLEQRKEQCRDTRRMNLVDNLQRDLCYALRALKRSPGFTATVIATLALGIGGVSAVFSLLNTVILNLLPLKAPEALYYIGRQESRMSMTWNYPDYRAMRDHNTVFTGLAGYSLGLESLGVQFGDAQGQSAVLTHGIFVSGNYFSVLGVSPALGRLFNTADDRAPGASPYVVLNYSYWQSHFNGDTRVIGRNIRINGYPFTVVGVTQSGFNGMDIAFKPGIFIPIMMRSEVLHVPYTYWNDRHNWWMAVVGRMKPGTPVARAEGELFAICKSQELAESHTLANPKWANTADHIVLEPAACGYSYFADELKSPLVILFAIVAIVLLIACANVANLLLARGAARQREIAMRLAIGASRLRLAMQLLTESTLIAILGGGSGILVALAGIPILLRFIPHSGVEPVTGIDARLDWHVLLFTLTVSVLTGLLFGVAPALQATRPDLVPALKEDLPGTTGIRRFTARKGLVILQVALSAPLLVGAGLFARTLENLRAIDAGFTSENVFIASVDPTQFGYKGERTRNFYDRLCERVAALPGVRSASLAFITPLTGASWNDNVTVEGYAPKSGGKNNVFFDAVGPRYFETLNTPLLLGRDFTQQDNPATAIEMPDHIGPGQNLPDPPGGHVAIVNEMFARRFFGNRSAIGMHVTMQGPFHSSYEIVGVAKNARYFGLRSAVQPMMFIPVWRDFVERRELVIRTADSASQIVALIRREIHQLDPVIPLLNVHTLEQDIDESILVERLVTSLCGFFGVVALMLCVVGLYGVVAYNVTRRTREIGIRMAVGASPASVLKLVFEDVAVMIIIGAILGAVLSVCTTSSIKSILYGVKATDPVSIVLAATALVLAAILASFVPARRAAKVDPIAALRYE